LATLQNNPVTTIQDATLSMM